MNWAQEKNISLKLPFFESTEYDIRFREKYFPHWEHISLDLSSLPGYPGQSVYSPEGLRAGKAFIRRYKQTQRK